MKKSKIIILTILTFIASLFLMNPTGYKINENQIFTLKNIQILSNELSNTKKEISDLKLLIELSETKLVDYENILGENNEMKKMLLENVEYYKMYSGFTDVRGKGIMVRISDNMQSTIGNYNLDIVHDIDIAVIINDLRNAGAEAIAINGKRIINSTEIICAGPLIKINGEGVAAPFIIKTIGNPDTLSAAIDAPNTYAYRIEEIYGIDITTTESDDILIPKYEDNEELLYIENIKEGW